MVSVYAPRRRAMRPFGYKPAALGVAALLALAAACGNTNDLQGDEPSTVNAASKATKLAAIDARLKQYSGIPKWEAPGPAIDATGLDGKRVLLLPSSTSIPFLHDIDVAAIEALKLAGVTATEFQGKADVADWTRAINQAVNERVAAIVLVGAPNPGVLVPQIEAADDAGVPVIVAHLFGEEDEVPAVRGLKANLPAPFSLSGQLMADWTIKDAGDNPVNALIVVSSGTVSSPAFAAAVKTELAKMCVTTCKTQEVKVTVPQWGTRIQPEVQSKLAADPTINYVIPLYDAMAIPAAAGVRASGRQANTKVVTFNGTPSVLKLIQDEQGVAMDVAESPDWLGYRVADQVLRIMLGKEPATGKNEGIRVIDASNVDETGTPPAANGGFGTEYATAFRKLWGLGDAS